ncbi:2Fe-2S iron-sulfur cluster binding domain-containing protein [Paraburkholderia sp. LEh10]|uniref:2Fe-2S iron-sulfur cluster-binding protein n=1 Tax=Paraburkholderia sp. LEh10 TaxID=2821353 RepID=UPI001AE41C4A|nr:2Fe-2S iron-sulfur cluster-binding protein [Paraburkholderia sp. LEh10]MBP0590407.1 2Fe-2S iron-sulfur cluster binding domain-containing protein [Paraburkholderia sp. LEh10]
MPVLFVVDRNGSEHAIEGEQGQSVMELIRDSGKGELSAVCGGCCSCATCHIYVDEDFASHISSISEDENDLLDSSEYRTPASRLACQISFVEALNGLRVTIAPES